MAEKRKYRRLPVRALPCRVYQDGQLIDLSIGGAFVATERPLPSGSHLTLEVTLPGEGTIRAQTQVQWSGDYFQGSVGRPCLGMGLQFTDIGAPDRGAITRFLVHVHQVTRAAQRVEADLAARVRIGDIWAPGRVRALNERGLFFESTAMAPLGQEVDILVRLPGAPRPVDFMGIVLRITGGDPSGGNGGGQEPESKAPWVQVDDGSIAPPRTERGLEIALTELPPRSRELLQGFLSDARDEARAPAEIE